MTRNQIAYADLKEKKRKNTADIRLARDKLAEELANNLRNYSINVQKNRITALANDELNERELAKLSEQIRSNLVKELETQRHNLSDEEIRRMKNTIDSLKNKYEAGPIIAALLGLMSDTDVQNLYGTKGVSTAQAIQGILNNVFGGEDKSINKWDTKKPGQFVTREDINKDHQPGNAKTAWRHNDEVGDKLTQDIANYLNAKDKKVNVNEIPTDFTNSKGPSSSAPTYNNRVERTNLNIPSANQAGYSPRPPISIPTGERSRTSGGTDYNLSGGLRSSGVIISPGANF